MRDEEIKKCPFCGGEATVTVMRVVGESLNARYWCKKCKASARPSKLNKDHDAAVAEARNIWNRRMEFNENNN